MSLVPFRFENTDIYTVTIDGKPWTRVKEVCKVMEYGRNTKTADKVRKFCSLENFAHKHQLSGLVVVTTPVN